MAFKMKGFGGFGDGTGSSFKKETNYLDDKRNPPKKTKSPPKGKIGSEYRRKEYDARGWKYDDTIAGYNKDGTKKKEGTKDKKDTNKKDNQWGAGDVAMAGHSLYEVGKYGKKMLKKHGSKLKNLAKGGKEFLKKGGKELLKKGGGVLALYGGADAGSKVLTGRPFHENVKDFFNPWSDTSGGKATVKEKKKQAKRSHNIQKKSGATTYTVGGAKW